MGERERDLFLEILSCYPSAPTAGPSLSRHSEIPDAEAAEQLLEEALAEQAEENRRLLQHFMLDFERFQPQPTGLKLTLSEADVEWLLQVLNDVRVGSWLKLGSPEEQDFLEQAVEQMTGENRPTIWALEMSGYFEMQFLKALTGS
jgi:hypothetical protein